MSFARSTLLRCLAVLACLIAVACRGSAQVAQRPPSAKTLPIFFFHGVGSNAKAGTFLQKNLETETRPFVSLTFCEGECSIRDLPTQVNMAIDQIRAAIKNDTRFAGGYSFIAHSQGSPIARAVIESMDDHKVHTFISLAGAANGNFYGPQVSDRIPLQVFLKGLAPKMMPTSVIDFSSYTAADMVSGKMQIDFLKVVNAQPSLQAKLSVANLLRSPVRADFVSINKFLPAINNVDSDATTAAVAESARRKSNFLRLKAAHFFASPQDEVISPWQSSILGQYSEVESMATLTKQFAKLKIVAMKKTSEYKLDTYGLRTLDRRGGLFLYAFENVGHGCWVADSVPTGSTSTCQFQPVFEKSVLPLLGSPAAIRSRPEVQSDAGNAALPVRS